MNILFIASTKKREKDVAQAFCEGVISQGDSAEWTTKRVADISRYHLFDAVVMIGVKSRKFWEAALARGATPIMLDKGYVRSRARGSKVWEFWRVSIGKHQPLHWLRLDKMPPDRWNTLGLKIPEWRPDGNHILLAGSSAKYHEFMGLGHPSTWAKLAVKRLQNVSKRPIIYRPKPSYREATPLPNTEFSGPKSKLPHALTHCWAVVTHGSNISFEAMLHGIPSIVTGGGVGAPISASFLDEIEGPYLATMNERLRFARNLAYWQWTENEMRSGEAWEFLRPRLAQWRE